MEDIHKQTLSKYVFYVNHTDKNKNFYQAYTIGKETKLNGISEDGFVMNLYKDNKQSCFCLTVIDLYKAIRGENENINAHKLTNK